MAAWGEDVAGSIDAQVKDAIGKMVGEIRSSIEDVRVAVDQQLTAALQSVQADVKAITLLPEIKKAIAELEQAAPAAAAAPSAASTDASRVKRALQAIEGGRSQVDVLNSLLEQCLQFGSRAALLILRAETFSGWKGVGFSSHGGNDENIKRFNAAPGLIPQLDEVLRQEHVVDWDGENLASRFGVTGGARALLIPMVIKDKVAATIYVDAVPEDLNKLDRSSLEILVFTTGLLVDTLAIRKKTPSPSLSASTGDEAAAPRPVSTPAVPPQRPAPAAAVPAQPVRPAAAVPTPAPRPAAPAPAPRPVPPAPAPEPVQRPEATVAFSASQMRDMIGVGAPKATAFDAPAMDFNAPISAPMSAPVSAPPAPPKAPAKADEGRPSTQFVPSAGVGRAASGGSAPTEESKKHDEARRFARLLVSEIKLYNEAKVEQGRKGRDLYERLKEDIDRSRQMYDERISEDVRKGSNYFYDELVRILADGNTEALGL